MILARLFSKLSLAIKRELQTLNPTFLEVVDESWMHETAGDTHFKILIVSPAFEGLNTPQRQHIVNNAMKDIWKQEIRTIAVTTHSPKEYQDYQQNKFIYDYPNPPISDKKANKH